MCVPQVHATQPTGEPEARVLPVGDVSRLQAGYESLFLMYPFLFAIYVQPPEYG